MDVTKSGAGSDVNLLCCQPREIPLPGVDVYDGVFYSLGMTTPEGTTTGTVRPDTEEATKALTVLAQGGHILITSTPEGLEGIPRRYTLHTSGRDLPGREIPRSIVRTLRADGLIQFSPEPPLDVPLYPRQMITSEKGISFAIEYHSSLLLMAMAFGTLREVPLCDSQRSTLLAMRSGTVLRQPEGDGYFSLGDEDLSEFDVRVLADIGFISAVRHGDGRWQLTSTGRAWADVNS